MAAPKGNKFAEGNKGGGRPSRYKPEYARIAKSMCALGATTADLAETFGVAASTICAWQVSHQEFSESLRVGKKGPDIRVERSLYQRALGYEYQAEKVVICHGEPVVVKYREHVPPDTAACKFWLINRRKNEWADTQRVDHDAAPTSPLAQLARELMGTALRPRGD